MNESERRRAQWLDRLSVIAALSVSALFTDVHDCTAKEKKPSKVPVEAPYGLNRDLLSPRDGGRVIILVTPNEDGRVSTVAVDRLAVLAAQLGGMPVEVKMPGTEGFVDFACDWTVSCRCPTNAVDPNASYVDVSFVHDKRPMFGLSRTIELDTNCLVGPVYRILINLRATEENRVLGLTAARLETRAIVHEYGHLIGLCMTEEHTYLAGDGRTRHCKKSGCAMSGPSPKAKVYAAFRTGLFGRNVEDYCELCKRDIAEAKQYWASETPSSAP